MKKIGLVIILVMLMIVPATAQITWGVRGGLAYSSLVQKIDNNYQSGARFGFSVAGLAQIRLFQCDGRSGCRFLPVWKNAY